MRRKAAVVSLIWELSFFYIFALVLFTNKEIRVFGLNFIVEKMQRRESEFREVLQNENIKASSNFALSEVGSLYFGPNPSSEARRLLEQAKELIRENERIQEEKEMILRREAELRDRKVYLNSENTGNDVLRPNTELQRLLSKTMDLSDEGKQIDQRKAQLELYYKELKRRKEFLQNAIKMYEESELGRGFSSVSFSNENNIEQS